MSIKSVNRPEPEPGKLTLKELYPMAVGQVIGAGVVTLIVPAIKMTGYSAWLAYLAAIILGFIVVLPTIFLSSTLRLGGGTYSMLAGVAGPRVAGIFAVAFLVRCFSPSLHATSVASYIGDVIPALGSPNAVMIMGMCVITFFFVINLFGVNIMAKIQKFITWFLIGALAVFAVVGMFKIRLPIFDFANPDFLVNGWTMTFTDGKITGGFLGAVLLFIYSCQGYMMTSAYGKDCENAYRDIPRAMLLTPLTLMILYVGVAMVGVGVMSLDDYGSSTTLVYAAQRIFPPWAAYLFIIGGPICALMSTLNGTFCFNAINIGAAATDGWLPRVFGKKNRFGANYVALCAMWLLAIIPMMFRLSVTSITNMTQILVSLFSFLEAYAFLKMPRKYPKSWAASRLHVPNWLYYTCLALSTLVYCVTLWKACLSLNPALAAANIIFVAAAYILGAWRGRQGDITLNTAVWPLDKSETEQIIQ